MTIDPATRGRLRELADKWRKVAALQHRGANQAPARSRERVALNNAADARCECATELEAFTAALPVVERAHPQEEKPLDIEAARTAWDAARTPESYESFTEEWGAELIVEVERLRAALSVPPSSQPGWQPILFAPMDGTRILCIDENGDQFVAFWDDSFWQQWLTMPPQQTDGGYGCGNPTHWIPLPSAPSSPQEEQND